MPKSTMLTVALVASASAFSPASPLRAARPAVIKPAVVTTTRTAPPPAMLLSPLKIAISVPTLYALMSVNEYATHRWYQHEEFNRPTNPMQILCQRIAKLIFKRPLRKPDGRNNIIKLFGGGHVEHHAETYDDMSLKKDERWCQSPAAKSLNGDIYRGTAFSWMVHALMTFQMLPTTLPVFALLGFSLLETMVVLLPGMFLHAIVWNMLHPPMHGLPDVSWRYGISGKPIAFLRNTGYFRYIYENHQGHHVLGGQANYNVCCPLTDHLLGTYVKASVWSKKMRAVPGPDATQRWGVPVEPAGVPQAPVIGAGLATEADLTPTALA